MTDVHGDVWARGARYDHAVNVATGGPPDWLRALLRRELDDEALTAYPDERAAAEAIAFRHGRAPEEVVLLNGAAHGFALVAQVLAPRRPAVVHPQFTEPERVLGGGVEQLVLRDPYTLERAAVDKDIDLVVVGNPTNPTGVLHPRGAIRGLVREGRTVVVDEAFMDFIPGEPETLAGEGGAGVIVLRSLTKILAVPGLRVGYLMADAALAERLRSARSAWPVNGLALAVARATALHPERLVPVAERAARDRAALGAMLAAQLPDARVYPGAANFLLVALPPDGPDALTTAAGLRDAHGIAIRPASTFPGLSAHHVRLTPRGGEHDARLVAALRTAVADGR
ncbi:aminotransferase class I/II-fold pyridoxal phosphate-dependent enzyme [Baekduia sp. Peel2402]|uniref:aminotransferase class I/II-fold pyridoxal phosphate-dependent enzyme n=1 Tax=Baekduia sp. Peel2402 TaxID=3458296 RepID=UPI00403E3686